MLSKSKKVRYLKVYEQSGYNYKPAPVIMLKGQWLKEAGFDVGDPVRVQCENGRLIIVLDRERAKMEAEKQAYIEGEVKKFRAQLVAEYTAKYGTKK